MESIHLFDTQEFKSMMDLVRRLRDEGYNSDAKALAEAFDRAGVPGVILETRATRSILVADLVRQAFPTEFNELTHVIAKMKPIAA